MKKQNKGTNMVIVKLMLCVTAFVTWYMSNGIYVSAATANIGEKAGNWVLDQIFWVGVIALAIVLLTCLIKRAWVAALITGIAGGIILFFIKKPTILSDLGDVIYHAIFG